MMQFIPIRVFPDQPTYGAIMGQFTFVITRLPNRKFHASVKPVGAKKFDDTRQDLGNYSRFNDAVKACDDFYHQSQNLQ